MMGLIKRFENNVYVLLLVSIIILPAMVASAQDVKKESDNPVDVSVKANVENGKRLFNGIQRFKNKGPACISCHNLNVDEIITGGLLAKDLTNVYSRLGGTGVTSMISTPPFPAMKVAYDHHALTEQEVKDIELFLQKVDENKYQTSSIDYGNVLVFGGIGTMIMLLILASLVWYTRKKYTVKKSILDRQLSSK
jgi:hypothetical protein